MTRKNVPDQFGRLYIDDVQNGCQLGIWVRRAEVDALLDEIDLLKSNNKFASNLADDLTQDGIKERARIAALEARCLAAEQAEANAHRCHEATISRCDAAEARCRELEAERDRLRATMIGPMSSWTWGQLDDWIDRRNRAEAALRELVELGEQGMKPDYSEWLTFHDKVAQVARQALGSEKETQ